MATGDPAPYSIVAGMVTRRKVPISKSTPKPTQVLRMKLFIREWRKHMNVSAVDCAEALDIERESYLRLEREPWRITVGELDVIAEAIGIKTSQLRFPPPAKGQEPQESLDDLLEDAPDNVRQMAFAAIRGMLGK